MGKFGWSYPPGCSGVPDDDVPDPPLESERMYELLEDAGVDQDVIDEACKIIETLVGERDRECPQCLDRHAREIDRLERRPSWARE